MDGLDALIFVEGPLPVAGWLSGANEAIPTSLEDRTENVIGLVSALAKWLDQETLRDIVFVLRAPDMFSQIVLSDHEPYSPAIARFARRLMEAAADSPGLRVSTLSIPMIEEDFDERAEDLAERVGALLCETSSALYIPKYFEEG
jgi:hypothetical protein